MLSFSPESANSYAPEDEQTGEPRSPTMKVLQVLPSIGSESGGPARSTLANCRALHAADPSIETILVTTDQNLSKTWEANIRALLPRRMDLKIFPAIGQAAFTFSPQLLAWIQENGAKYDLVVIRALLHPISTSAAWIVRRQAVPYLVVPHGTLSHYTFSHRRTLLKRLYFSVLEARTLRGAAAVQFTCTVESEEAPRWGGSCLRTVIPHPYDLPRVDLGPISARNHQVLFLSRLHPKKGLDVLLPAFAQLLHFIPDATLVLAGSGAHSYEYWIRRKIACLRLEDHVQILGFVDGPAKDRLLAESAVFVLPSHHENFGIAVVEAMAAGLPVVISKGVGISEDIARAEAGVVLDERSSKAVLSALRDLLRDKDRRLFLGLNGQRLVDEHFAPAFVGAQLVSLYRIAARVPHTVKANERKVSLIDCPHRGA